MNQIVDILDNRIENLAQYEFFETVNQNTVIDVFEEFIGCVVSVLVV